MSSERMMVLNMVSDGKLAVDDAVRLLSLLTGLETEDLPSVADGAEVLAVGPEAGPLEDVESAIDMPAEQTEPPEPQQPGSGWGIWSRFKQFVSSIG